MRKGRTIPALSLVPSSCKVALVWSIVIFAPKMTRLLYRPAQANKRPEARKRR
jgi:hypothetical protein